jgi:hypothetical protein
MAKIVGLFPPFLDAGSEGPPVTLLHLWLIHDGYGTGKIDLDGTYGPVTVAAVKELQRDLGVEDDGNFGSETRARYEEAFGFGIQINDIPATAFQGKTKWAGPDHEGLKSWPEGSELSKDDKLPAHEVILGLLEEAQALAHEETNLSDRGATIRLVIRQATCVVCARILANMKVPEKERGKILKRLRAIEPATLLDPSELGMWSDLCVAFGGDAIRWTSGGVEYSDVQTDEFSEFVAQLGYFRPSDLDNNPVLRKTDR